MRDKTYLFEISWEVCNKVGGIYTVIKSKTADAQAAFANYYVVGPYFSDKHAAEFIEEPAPKAFSKIFEELKNEGIICHYGKWLTDVEVNAILIEFNAYASNKDKIKTELWENYSIDSLYTSFFDFDETAIWAYAAGKLIEKFSSGKKVIAHCHEWLAGPTLLYLKSHNAKVATVFTTHATVLGRYFGGTGLNIYDAKFSYSLDKEEYKTSLLPKHQVEQQSAKNADVFTTVSAITAIEAEKFLGVKADVLLLNGLNIGKFPTFEEAAIKHQLYKGKIKQFLIYYFFPHYSFNLDNTLFYFLASRNEFHGKGMDIFINSLGELNKKLKAEKSNKTIVAFFWVPGAATSIKGELVENKTIFKDVKEAIADEHDILLDRLLTSVIVNRSACDETYLLGDKLLNELKRKLIKFKRPGLPLLTTHDLQDEQSNEILNAFKSANLLNKKEDCVKVILYPIYLTGTDNLLALGYYEAMQGAHLGVFPSYYEPWGYTPVEAAALGVASVTTDLSGFGRYISSEGKEKKLPGISVIKRLGKSDSTVTLELTKMLHSFSKFSVQERINNKMEAKRIASITDWKYMIKNYLKAYDKALKNKGI